MSTATFRQRGMGGVGSDRSLELREGIKARTARLAWSGVGHLGPRAGPLGGSGRSPEVNNEHCDVQNLARERRRRRVP